MGVKKTDLAWAAGFYDGEGCMSCAKCRDSHQVYIAIAQKDIRPLLKFQAIFGVGKIRPRFGNSSFKEKAWINIWRTDNFTEVKRIYNLMKPYLSQMKIDQAEDVIARVNKGRRYL
jgi:hypothetical protein